MMGDIYRQATLVLAWLGPCTTEQDIRTHLAMDFLASDTWGWEDPSASRVLRCVKTELFQRSYWGRMWILQEFILAPDLQLWCGEYMAHLSSTVVEHLSQPFYETKSMKYELASIHFDAPAWDLLAQRYLPRDFDPRAVHYEMPGLLHLLTKCRRMQCEDGRDKIYALLALLDPLEADELDIRPDYSLSTRQLYLQVSKKLLQLLKDQYRDILLALQRKIEQGMIWLEGIAESEETEKFIAKEYWADILDVIP